MAAAQPCFLEDPGHGVRHRSTDPEKPQRRKDKASFMATPKNTLKHGIHYTFPFQDVHIFLGPFFQPQELQSRPCSACEFPQIHGFYPTAEQLSRFGYQWLCRFHAADHSPTVPAISVENSGKFIVVERNIAELSRLKANNIGDRLEVIDDFRML